MKAEAWLHPSSINGGKPTAVMMRCDAMRPGMPGQKYDASSPPPAGRNKGGICQSPIVFTVWRAVQVASLHVQFNFFCTDCKTRTETGCGYITVVAMVAHYPVARKFKFPNVTCTTQVMLTLFAPFMFILSFILRVVFSCAPVPCCSTEVSKTVGQRTGQNYCSPCNTVSTVNFHTCGLKTRGALFCWGEKRGGYFGAGMCVGGGGRGSLGGILCRKGRACLCVGGWVGGGGGVLWSHM